jgi:hypothetical protein
VHDLPRAGELTEARRYRAAVGSVVNDASYFPVVEAPPRTDT